MYANIEFDRRNPDNIFPEMPDDATPDQLREAYDRARMTVNRLLDAHDRDVAAALNAKPSAFLGTDINFEPRFIHPTNRYGEVGSHRKPVVDPDGMLRKYIEDNPERFPGQHRRSNPEEAPKSDDQATETETETETDH